MSRDYEDPLSLRGAIAGELEKGHTDPRVIAANVMTLYSDEALLRWMQELTLAAAEIALDGWAGWRHSKVVQKEG